MYVSEDTAGDVLEHLNVALLNHQITVAREVGDLSQKHLPVRLAVFEPQVDLHQILDAVVVHVVVLVLGDVDEAVEADLEQYARALRLHEIVLRVQHGDELAEGGVLENVGFVVDPNEHLREDAVVLR